MNLIDKKLLSAIFAIIIFGLIMVLSASFPDHGFAKFYKQIFFLFVSFISVAILFGWLKFSSESFAKHPVLLYLVAILLLLLVFAPIDGNKANGATRWITLPYFKIH